MLDRASVVDEQFIRCVKEGTFPSKKSKTRPHDVGLSQADAIDLFDSQIKSRLLDIIARKLKDKGLSFYTIGSSGHEGNAVLGKVFSYQDMAFLHYRSGAFFLQRAKQLADMDGERCVLLSLVAASTDPISGGRHKVFGSKPLNIPPQTSTIASHLPKALGAAISITRANELGINGALAKDSVILCSFGDASLNHASAQCTLNSLSWIRQQSYPLPLVMICEDNGIGISVPTPKNWVEDSVSHRLGIHYISCDGLNIADVWRASHEAMTIARVKKQPVFLHMRCVRLLGHAGSDIEIQYKTQAQIEANEFEDPLLHSAAMMIDEGFMTQDGIIELYELNRRLLEAKAKDVLHEPKMMNAQEIMSSIIPKFPINPPKTKPDDETRQRMFAEAWAQLSQPRNMCQLINLALTDLMIQYPQMLIFGEDVSKKGGVYRVTADLVKRFGQRRVFDTLLDETTILGTAIGLAHNGFIPVPEIQFLAYLHNAEDQLRGEASTLSFFSSGQYQNPMLIRIAGLAYQRGFGGHFHNDNSIAVLRDLPGVIVVCPSNGADAVKLLRESLKLVYEQGRIVVFIEPIALYMTKDLHQAGDNGWLCQYPAIDETIHFGDVSVHGTGDTAIITYGNGCYLSTQAIKVLKEQYQVDCRLIDLHWLSPLPVQSLIKSLKGVKRILIVDEGRRSASISEALITALYEQGVTGVRLSRITGEDCFIPLGNAWEYVLPSRDGIIQSVLSLFKEKQEQQRGRFIVS